MKCKSCGEEIDVKDLRIGKGNPSCKVKCPFCEAINHIKCRHKTGKPKKTRIVSPQRSLRK